MIPPAKTFQNLIVWQKAHALVLLIYSITKKFPKSELFGITSQLQRSAVSIPANIAEGFKKRTTADKARYLNIAQASLEETRYYLILANDLKFCQTENALDQLEEVSKLLESYYQKVRSK
ncbi:MAG: four helix bundle protein [Phycisphaerae bacterium]|nr:four helix bundle protein [Phycisphaerae bacterium]